MFCWVVGCWWLLVAGWAGLGGFALVVRVCFSCLGVILVLVWFGLWVRRFAAGFAGLWGCII